MFVFANPNLDYNVRLMRGTVFNIMLIQRRPFWLFGHSQVEQYVVHFQLIKYTQSVLL